MVVRACSPSYSWGWGRRIAWAQKVEDAVSRDCAITPAWVTRAKLHLKEKKRKKLESYSNRSGKPLRESDRLWFMQGMWEWKHKGYLFVSLIVATQVSSGAGMSLRGSRKMRRSGHIADMFWDRIYQTFWWIGWGLSGEREEWRVMPRFWTILFPLLGLQWWKGQIQDWPQGIYQWF